jgi:hypothetical protein
MRKTLLISCLLAAEPATMQLEATLRNGFDSEKTSLDFFHQHHSLVEIVQFLKDSHPKIEHHIVFDHSCRISKIVETKRAINAALPGYNIKYHYRKYRNEQLQRSMQNFGCFDKLQKELGLAIAA